MTDDESLHAAIHEIVDVRPHDPAWPSAFARGRERLLALLPGAFVAIEHIGSTAVPGLVAKPVIDMLAGVLGPIDANPLVLRPRDCGYIDGADLTRTAIGHRWFMRWHDGHRTHQLHVVEHGSVEWQRRLRFREALRADPDLAARYAELKLTLAARFRHDRDAYTAGKSAFVVAVTVAG